MLKLAVGALRSTGSPSLCGTLFILNEPFIPTVASDGLRTGLLFRESALEPLLALPLTAAGSVAPSTGCRQPSSDSAGPLLRPRLSALP